MYFQTNISNINPSNFSIIEKGRSTVRLLIDSQTLKKYAVKFVASDNDSLQKEAYLLEKFNHPSIIRSIEFGTLKKENYLVSEYMDYGDLLTFVTQNELRIYSASFLRDSINFEKFWRTIFLQGLEALLHMKSLGWAHLDVKPENFLINSDFQVKLIDFEFAFKVEASSECSIFCGSPSYFCPQIKERKVPYDAYKADVFSLGVTMLNLMTRSNIFGSEAQYIAMKKGRFEQFWKNLRFLGFSNDFKGLVEKMLSYEEKQRSSLEEVRGDPWFQKESFGKEEIKEFFRNIKITNERKQSFEDASSKKIKIKSD